MAHKKLHGPVNTISAQVRVPTSKSLTNRGLVAAAVAGGGVIHQPLDCEDTRLLAEALAAAGWPVSWNTTIRIGSRTEQAQQTTAWIGNSGTGSRFLLALLSAVAGRSVVDGTPRLRQRPMQPLLDALDELGARCSSAEGFLPVTIDGRRLQGGSIRMRPGTSSQFVSALLLAAPLMAKGLTMKLEEKVPSRPYLDLTDDVLRRFGAALERTDDGTWWRVRGTPLQPTDLVVEGDWSAAAFFLAAVAVAGGSIEVAPLVRQSRQGDRTICEVLGNAGLRIEADGDVIRARGPISGPIRANLRDTPDMFPALVAVAACSPYRSRLEGLENLRHKESDRLAVMVENLQRLGARLQVDGSSCQVEEPVPAAGGDGVAVTAAADHRVAMAMAVVALRAGALELDDPDCVGKSFPDFWQQWEAVAR